MNAFGWSAFVGSWILIIGLNLFCFWRVFNEPTEEL